MKKTYCDACTALITDDGLPALHRHACFEVAGGRRFAVAVRVQVTFDTIEIDMCNACIQRVLDEGAVIHKTPVPPDITRDWLKPESAAGSLHDKAPAAQEDRSGYACAFCSHDIRDHFDDPDHTGAFNHCEVEGCDCTQYRDPSEAVAVAPADHREDIGTDIVARLDDDNIPL